MIGGLQPLDSRENTSQATEGRYATTQKHSQHTRHQLEPRHLFGQWGRVPQQRLLNIVGALSAVLHPDGEEQSSAQNTQRCLCSIPVQKQE